jgi:hypothetical protein
VPSIDASGQGERGERRRKPGAPSLAQTLRDGNEFLYIAYNLAELFEIAPEFLINYVRGSVMLVPIWTTRRCGGRMPR